MMRLNFLLYLGVLLCALCTVTARHQARKLYVDLQKQQEIAKQYQVEWGQLQLEQSTWAMHQRVEKIAEGQLGMMRPTPQQMRVIVP